ncbi:MULTISPECIES: GTP-sensing pleiotropic transcriptional regulator CodY [Brevibacillus]|jgi:GTP-sensing transcriptional pleiotropic repressor CodY|uniref:Global transcriptional regulator CodY n=1 Tax=Brevibacillus parabrevis TaxID=54914 RepID=A0A4Y3PHR4_BREPA|nr:MULTISPECIES: GTP-sensing pleiotropic transcriptional regulator CodY [Brevibacillus]MBU8714324.1 GTP-sensing pleiotropic transcriptional regulator CodY [Brevibacillus parabrevis]MDH6351458.1 transcriptional pleiotropic repressor [Brevibacillus sp. 1238]MDR4998833.1 GTP-sensing pleiotropic transcriptional regulator CodY [Brevibacillus parabrevis]MED1723692.1 GTP-sensing pleiotropic transcriptional regulator CodY [Brevibacillus parabrevis]MED2254967.1 GTP-sensing pleiotropic transcriptional r
MNLLEKTRKINVMLQKTMGGSGVGFQDLAKLLSEVISANVYIITADGSILGSGMNQEISLNEEGQTHLQSGVHQKLLEVTQTLANESIQSPYSFVPKELGSLFPQMMTTIVPINAGGSRLGTLVLLRAYGEFETEDLILGEIGATVIGMKIVRQRTEQIENEVRDKTFAKIALSSLSYSEQIAIEKIMEQLDAREGLLVASQLADQAGLTRSVIVNALRKLASAGVLESRSLGMKGTYIKVLNDKFPSELAKWKTS